VKVESSPAVVDVGARMLRIFAPQITLYGVAIVLGGVLQAHRRFVWPVLAPLLSSMAVIATYAAYGAAVHTDVPHVPVYGQMILAVGTTLGVVVLSLCLIVPARGLHLAARPTLRFEAGTRRTVGGLAAVGVVTVAAQQLALAYAVYLANRGTLPATGVAPAIGGTGHGSPIYVFTLAQTIYLVPWGVLAVPVAISVYPELATAASVGDDTRYRGTLAAASRTVLLLCALGAAAMIAVARPAARLIGVVSNVPAGALATAIIAFAPGLVGFGLFALHSRALYARGENRFAALATAIGWTAVIVGSGVLAAVVPRDQRVTALAAANSAGMVVLAVALAVIIVRRTGAASLAGLPRATLAGVVAGAAAAVAGIAVRAPLPADPGVGGDVLQGMLSGFVAAVVFLAVAAAADRHDVRPLLARLLRFVGFGRAASRSGDNEDQREQ
jgi:putative peptidoglycan lipid II flippase